MTEPIIPSIPAGGAQPDAAQVLAAIQEFRQGITKEITDIRAFVDSGKATADEVQAFGKRIEDLADEWKTSLEAHEVAIKEIQANAKRPTGNGGGGDDVVGPFEFLMQAGLRDALDKWQSQGRMQGNIFSLDLGKYYDQQKIAPNDSRKRQSYLSMRNRQSARLRQSLTTGRYDETSGSLAHFQPEFVESGFVREPDPPTSVLRVLGVVNQAQAVYKFNRRSRRLGLVGSMTAQTASGAGPHTFTFDGVEGWIGLGASGNVICRHTNGTEETGFTITTTAAISTDDAESKLNIGTIGITGTLASNMEIGDTFYLADPADNTVPARALPAGVREGEKAPIGKWITTLVTLYAAKFPIAWKIPEERLEDEAELAREMQTDFDEIQQWTLARQVWQGSGTAGTANERQVTGILQDAGRQTQNQQAGEQAFDTMARAIELATGQGHMPAAFFLHPTVIRDMRLLKDADGRYLADVTDGLGRVWNVPVFPEVYMNDSDTDIGCLICQNSVQIRSVGQTVFAMTNSDGEDFTAGIITMKLVPRLIVAVKRPLGVVQMNFSP